MGYSRESNGTEAAIQGRKKWDAENLKRVSLAIDKTTYDVAKALAEHDGKSFNRFVLDCIQEHIDNFI